LPQDEFTSPPSDISSVNGFGENRFWQAENKKCHNRVAAHLSVFVTPTEQIDLNACCGA
jgi:hypothetical protein